MSRKVTATETKATILALLDEGAAGSKVEMIRHDRTVPRPTPATGRYSLKGICAGMATTAVATSDTPGLFLHW